MAFINEGSCECAKNELDLFSLPATQTSIESGTYVEYHPVASTTGGAPIELDVTASGDDYLDFANSFLCVRAKITRATNDDFDASDTVGPVNNFLHSLFSQVDRGGRTAERQADHEFDQYVRVQSVHRDATELRDGCEIFAIDFRPVLQERNR
jgi:hypothetical protein